MIEVSVYNFVGVCAAIVATCIRQSNDGVGYLFRACAVADGLLYQNPSSDQFSVDGRRILSFWCYQIAGAFNDRGRAPPYLLEAHCPTVQGWWAGTE